MTQPLRRVKALIGLGSNLDDPAAQVRRALRALDAPPHTHVRRRSSLYRTAPWGVVDQSDFVNAVAEIETSLAPRDLLDALLAIERAQGRVRGETRWGPRTLDLDLLLYGDVQSDDPALTLPHLRIAERAFVLKPLAEIDADLVVPGQGRVRDLLARLDADDCVPIAGTLA